MITTMLVLNASPEITYVMAIITAIQVYMFTYVTG